MRKRTLTELTVLIDEETASIMKTRMGEGVSTADVVRKSVTVWDYLTTEKANGGRILIQKGHEIYELHLQ